MVAPKDSETVDGFEIKYHADGRTRWSKGKVVDGTPVGYWEGYRKDGTLTRPGHFDAGEPVGGWITYDKQGQHYKVTDRGAGSG
ncbi:toxin-antitoxin system YwqK family antitoxin [Nesterenkonia suensis]